MSPDNDELKAALRVVELYCSRKIPKALQDEIRILCRTRGNSITIFESRPPWNPELGPDWTETKVAQLRRDPEARTWSLFYPDRNGRWHPYPPASRKSTIPSLLTEVDLDPNGIFWG